MKFALLVLVFVFAAAAFAQRKPFDRDKITFENVREYAYTNADMVKKPVRGVYLNFHGAGYGDVRNEDSPFAKALAEAGVVEIFPYGTQDSWMKKGPAEEVEFLVDVIRRKYGIPDSVPVAFGGCSMGGFAALTFGLFSKIKPACVLANCPVNVPEDWVDFQKPGLLPGTLEGITHPLAAADRLPEADYFFISGTNDPIPYMARNTRALARRLRKRGLKAELYEGPIGHCGATEEMILAWNSFLFERLGVDAPACPYGSWY